MSITKPFLLKPAGKDYLWGGSRLKTEFNKDISMDPLAETWECSTHPDGPSMAASGDYNGLSLSQILKDHPEYLGMYRGPAGELPILIKFIDAKNDLSVQVHPDDDYARKYENGQLGKTEMWYVLDAEPGTKLVYGFSKSIEKEQLRSSLIDGTVEQYLNRIDIKKDDVFFIEAGTVHAIGAGALIIEIQENSNLTYRMYDYNRKGQDGQLRELHIDKALEVADLNAMVQPSRVSYKTVYGSGITSQSLCQCKYFKAERWDLKKVSLSEPVVIEPDRKSFQVFLCMNGNIVLEMEGGDSLNFMKGDCVFVPADSVQIKMHGYGQLLSVKC